MALNSNALATVALAQSYANVGSVDSTLFENLINGASSLILGAIGRNLQRASYTSERLTPSGRQLLMTHNYPIQTLTSVADNGVLLTADTDYRCDDNDKRLGFIWRGPGWYGPYYTGLLTADPVAWDRSIVVNYTAGFYFPGDVGYVQGAAASVPFELVDLCCRMVSEKYNQVKAGSFGLSGLTQENLSYQWDMASFDDGMRAEFAQVAAGYRDYR